ncbi:16S rRNA (adenine(1518)-N(6)/adenine(1519)-N(6))-dimethyltransferase RsmA [Lentibacillus sp. CBA3610]|uniref:16S rRNA (adenine(1518)-N(6)/adenine(1519)-N(6))- dimethyltransferase RsmA n=1 Tax=Lentibacillus sp. CBA3610 TaxID=2518176 RepID=UPI0015957E91|nr:16S rRNA (adenine(1518)-N(6)/adenine(1519)-N(6))-dimethyltransferase RsmA [Lentibacillus sp. CBA3610]QKY70885.1 16S rRNA (adenine(1518)-N(6)/adenine(1519)-N(6))-dimethyltransferase RsmA [Lentibacillus sp. CBA3610]
MGVKWIATPKRTKEILETYNFSFKKSLGQNFIIDTNILINIIQKADIDKRAGAIEIGPGIGALTEQLAIHADKVIAYEIDQRLLPVLDNTLAAYNNIHVIHQDILEANVIDMIGDHFTPDQPIHVVANLPYYITTPILMKLLREDLPVADFTVMIQKEVAERIAAKPNSKSYGSLSIAMQYYTRTEVVMNVPKSVFRPPPKVDSSVLKLTRRDSAPVQVADEDYFFAIVQACFAQRRKTLRNNLIRHFKSLIDKQTISNALQDAGIDETRRGESLTMQEFAALANAFYQITERDG